MERFFVIFLKGLWIGGTLTVPGVSGGTMAIVMGVYEHLLNAVDHLKDRKNMQFVITLGSGGLVGIVALSGIVTWLLKHHYTAVSFFFIGAVVGGIPAICREMRLSVFKWYQFFYFLGGIVVVLLIARLPGGIFSLSLENSILMQVLGGVIAAVALVLPGISVSHMLYVMGIYESVMGSIAGFKLLLLIPFMSGMLLGVFLTVKLVNLLLNRFKTEIYFVVLGFVLGSVGEMALTLNKDSLSIFHVLICIAGFLPLWLLHKKHKAGA